MSPWLWGCCGSCCRWLPEAAAVTAAAAAASQSCEAWLVLQVPAARTAEHTHALPAVHATPVRACPPSPGSKPLERHAISSTLLLTCPGHQAVCAAAAHTTMQQQCSSRHSSTQQQRACAPTHGSSSGLRRGVARKAISGSRSLPLMPPPPCQLKRLPAQQGVRVGRGPAHALVAHPQTNVPACPAAACTGLHWAAKKRPTAGPAE